MVIVPVRSVASAFGAALYDTAPDPAPDAPLVTISQSAFDVAVHADCLPRNIAASRRREKQGHRRNVIDGNHAAQ